MACKKCGGRFRWLKTRKDSYGLWNVFQCVICKTTTAHEYRPTAYIKVPSQKDKIGFARSELLHFSWLTVARIKQWLPKPKPIEETWTMGEEEKAIIDRANAKFDENDYKKNFVIVEHDQDGTVKNGK